MPLVLDLERTEAVDDHARIGFTLSANELLATTGVAPEPCADASACYDESRGDLLVFGGASDAGLNAIDARIPFPASGQQPAFLRGFRKALDEAGWDFEG